MALCKLQEIPGQARNDILFNELVAPESTEMEVFFF
jgi:hypothetical protein